MTGHNWGSFLDGDLEESYNYDAETLCMQDYQMSVKSGGVNHSKDPSSSAVEESVGSVIENYFIALNEHGHRVTTTSVRVPPPTEQPLPRTVISAAKSSPKSASRQQSPCSIHNKYHHNVHQDSSSSSARTTDDSSSLQQQQYLQRLQASKETTEHIRDLVKRPIANIWNRRKIDLIPHVCSPSLRFNGNTGMFE